MEQNASIRKKLSDRKAFFIYLKQNFHHQKQFHPEILTDEFYKELQGKGQKATSALFWTKYQFYTADIKDFEDSFKNQLTEGITDYFNNNIGLSEKALNSTSDNTESVPNIEGA